MTFGLTVQASDIVAGDTLWWETRAENARKRHCLIQFRCIEMFNSAQIYLIQSAYEIFNSVDQQFYFKTPLLQQEWMFCIKHDDSKMRALFQISLSSNKMFDTVFLLCILLHKVISAISTG